MARKTKEQLIQEEAWCWELRLQHPRWTQQQIADEIGKAHGVELSQSTISRALERANKRYLKSIEKNISAFKGQQMSRLEYIYGEAQSGWHRSYGTTKSMRKSTNKNTQAPGDDYKLRWAQAGNDPTKLPELIVNEEETVTMDMEDMAGSTAFLSEMRETVKEMNRVMGVNAPDESVLTMRGGGDYAAELPKPATKEEWEERMGGPLEVSVEKINHDGESEAQ